jgi:DNA-binding transcriptional LysR family regulator
MAQSSVSQHIQSLEAALGTPLFERSAQGVKPTSAGETLYRYAQQILTLVADAEREILLGSKMEIGHLTVCATPGISVYLLPHWLQRFQHEYPAFNVSLQTELTRDVVKDVLNNKDDLGFLEGELEELDSEQLGRFRISDVEYFVVVGPHHPWAGREQVSLTELSAEPFVNRLPWSRARRWLELILANHQIKLRNVAELDGPDAIKYALLSEMGITVLPDYSVEREAERKELFLLRIAELDLKRPLIMVWNAKQPFNAGQRAFISALAADTPRLQVLL